ncbi:protein transport protein Sec16A-like [Colossoma macropomum]|uniref:protein transport protein Sec16A-like n=1 Tax=Colossoma macropomum TaxID=42526 RepID=UPI001863C8EF|nr:protein transport protein Sec16A-like [Colossoma macropomum]
MASPHLPTPSRDPSLQAEDPPSISPGTSGISGVENYTQPENYFQPINDNDPLNSEYASITAGSPSTIGLQNPAPTEQLASSLAAQHVPSPDITPQTPSLQTCSMTVTQSLPNITTCALTTKISSVDPSDLGGLSSSTSSPTYSLLLHTKSASKTPSPQLLLEALNAVPSSHIAETPVQLGQSAGYASSSCSEQLHENSEVTSQLSHQQRSTSQQFDRPSEADQASDMNAIQQDAKELEKYIKQDRMDCISADKLLPGDDILIPSNISDPSSSFNGGINPKIPVEENDSSINTQESLKSITTLPGLSSAKASLEMLLVSEMPQLVSNVSINQIQVEHNQPNPSDLKPHVPPTIPEAKSGGSADYMPVLYLQVTKKVQEETQKATDSNLSRHPTVSTTSVPKKLRFRPSEPSGAAAHVLESLKNEDVQNLHGEQGHDVLDSNQKNPPVVRGSTTVEQRNSKKVSATSTKIHQPISPGLETRTHWSPQEVSRAHYNSYYGSIYPNYQNTDHQFSDKYSMHYSRAHHAWMDLNGHWPQMGSEAQLNNQKYQKEEQKQLEQSSSEHVHNSNQLTLRQKRSKDRSARVDQGKTSPYWYYNYGGWDPQGYYSSAYYQDYYYPYDYGYRAKVSTSNSQQCNTKPDNYDDWWKYDPRYDSTFDRDQFAQYQQSYWDQCDRQSSHSGYSTQSMPSTRSQHSRISWHSEQSWGYPTLQNTDYPPYDVSIQSPAHSEDRGQLEKETSNKAFNISCSPMSPSIPEQFSFPHCCAQFGPGGQLIQVLPNLPSEGKPALVQIHSTEMLLQGCWDQPELQAFPGPLTKDETPKSEVLDFVRKKYQECLQNNTLADKEASCLIWELLELVCKQNGKLVGTDISQLLLRKQRSPATSEKATSDLIDFTNEAISRTACNAELTTEDTFLAIPKDTERDLQCLRELLIFGRKKDALETAISKGLWGHAFMLASTMDSRAYSQVMSKFIDSLPENDALRTFYQLMSGRIPLSATHCGIKEWGDWCTHLAMVLSNHTRFKLLHKKTITRMGDALASKGCSDAARFCYVVAQLDVDTQSDKSDIFLFGSSSLPPLDFATNEAIQRTELFEYALSLGCDSVSLPHFQIFKFIYACRLAESGLCAQAFQYCEVISKALLASVSGQSLTLISQLIELSTKMRHFDQQLKDIPDLELSSEPEWLINLRRLHGQIIEELNLPSSKKQDTNCLPLLEKDPQGTSPKKTTTASYKVSLLTTKMSSQEEVLPKVCLVPPAPQDILKKRALPKSSQVPDPGCFELANKAVPLSTSPISQKPPHHADSNLPPVEEPVQALKPHTVPEPHLYILPSTAALLPEKLVHTDDARHLSEHQPNEAKESTPTLALPLPAPLSLHPTTVQSKFREDLQPQSLNDDPTATQFPMEPHTLSAATLPSSTSVATESKSLPQMPINCLLQQYLPLRQWQQNQSFCLN